MFTNNDRGLTDRIKRGQRVFLKHAASCSLGLLYYSLIGGFSAPPIVQVLDTTGYLTQKCDSTFRRLNETFEMVLESLESVDAMRVGGRGWKSIIKVRLLHSSVRLRILRSVWDSDRNGQPINQEDMMGTLLAFSINVLDSIKRICGSQVLRSVFSYYYLFRISLNFTE